MNRGTNDLGFDPVLSLQPVLKRNRCYLSGVYPPNFKEHNFRFEARMKEFAGPGVMHYVFDHSNPIYLQKDLFYDPDHLHVTGAQVFTNELISFLREREW